MKLVLSVGKIAGGTIDPEMMVNPSDNYFDDSLFFEVHGENEEEEHSTDEPKNIYPVLKGSDYNNYGFDHKDWNYKQTLEKNKPLMLGFCAQPIFSTKFGCPPIND